jgi:hypothetical protein
MITNITNSKLKQINNKLYLKLIIYTVADVCGLINDLMQELRVCGEFQH